MTGMMGECFCIPCGRTSKLAVGISKGKWAVRPGQKCGHCQSESWSRPVALVPTVVPDKTPAPAPSPQPAITPTTPGRCFYQPQELRKAAWRKLHGPLPPNTLLGSFCEQRYCGKIEHMRPVQSRQGTSYDWTPAANTLRPLEVGEAVELDINASVFRFATQMRREFPERRYSFESVRPARVKATRHE